MARITAPLLGLALAFGSQAHAGEPPVLLAMPERDPGAAAARALTPEQRAVLDAITDDPRVLELRLAWTPQDALAAVTEARAMALDVLPGGRVSFTGKRFDAEAAGMSEVEAFQAAVAEARARGQQQHTIPVPRQ